MEERIWREEFRQNVCICKKKREASTIMVQSVFPFIRQRPMHIWVWERAQDMIIADSKILPENTWKR